MNFIMQYFILYFLIDHNYYNIYELDKLVDFLFQKGAI